MRKNLISLSLLLIIIIGFNCSRIHGETNIKEMSEIKSQLYYLQNNMQQLIKNIRELTRNAETIQKRANGLSEGMDGKGFERNLNDGISLINQKVRAFSGKINQLSKTLSKIEALNGEKEDSDFFEDFEYPGRF